jgi:hypothetical protein
MGVSPDISSSLFQDFIRSKAHCQTELRMYFLTGKSNNQNKRTRAYEMRTPTTTIQMAAVPEPRGVKFIPNRDDTALSGMKRNANWVKSLT